MPDARWFRAQRAKARRAFFFLGYHFAMQLSAQLAMWGCTIFSLTCLGFALDGFLGLGYLTELDQPATSFVWFLTFLGVMTAGIGVIYWRMLKKAAQQAD